MDDTGIIEATLLEAVPVNKGRVVALASAMLSIDGIGFVLHGLQVVHVTDPATGRPALGVDLPRYRGPDGTWKQAVELPQELKKPLGDAVLAQCLAQGIVRRTEPAD